MGRDQPFNQRSDTGRMGFRHEGEMPDERPLLIYPHPFWSDDTERMTYEAAVEANPRCEGEGCMTYLARISAAVAGKYGRAVQSMPRARLTHREADVRLAHLRSQGEVRE